MLHVCFSEGGYQKLLFARELFFEKDHFCYLADDLSFGNVKNISDPKTRTITMQKFLDDFWDYKVDLAENHSSFCGYITPANEITVWYDNSPRDFCGLLYSLSNVVSSTAKIYGVSCSQAISRGHSIQTSCLEEIVIDAIPIYFSQKAEISRIEISKIKEQWNRLVAENSPLRVFQNNRIKSADITYYDSYILRFTSEKPVKIADVLGLVLSYLSRTKGISVNDGFLAMRIKKLIEDRVLIQTDLGLRFYDSLIRRNFITSFA